MLLVLWDIDGTLVDSAGHGRRAFEEAFVEVLGHVPDWVEFAGRTDHEIALAMLNGSPERLPAVLEQLAVKLEALRTGSRPRAMCIRASPRRSPRSTSPTGS